MDIVIKVLPWNAPENTIIFGRFVNAFAILTAFSSASAPLFAKNTFFLLPLTGAICVNFSDNAT